MALKSEVCSMHGYSDIPSGILEDVIPLSIDKEEENLVHRRDYAGEKVEKILLGSNGKILINPVEPVTKPNPHSSYDSGGFYNSSKFLWVFMARTVSEISGCPSR